MKLCAGCHLTTRCHSCSRYRQIQCWPFNFDVNQKLRSISCPVTLETSLPVCFLLLHDLAPEKSASGLWLASLLLFRVSSPNKLGIFSSSVAGLLRPRSISPSGLWPERQVGSLIASFPAIPLQFRRPAFVHAHGLRGADGSRHRLLGHFLRGLHQKGGWWRRHDGNVAERRVGWALKPTASSFALQIAGYVNKAAMDTAVLQRSLAILESMVLNSQDLYHKVAQEITIGQLIPHLQGWERARTNGGRKLRENLSKVFRELRCLLQM